MRWGFVSYIEDWPQVIEEIAKAEPHLRAVGRDDAADLLLVCYREFRDDLTKLGAKVAVAGTLELRAIEKATRVRDKRGAGPNHLGRALFVRDLAPMTGGLLPGAVGIADLEVLDDEVPWWPTNEHGSAARVGGKIFGTFLGPGSAAPDPTAFREHAIFRSNIGPDSGPGTIQRPIPARWFIKKASEVIDREWREQFDVIRLRFESRLDDVAHTYR